MADEEYGTNSKVIRGVDRHARKRLDELEGKVSTLEGVVSAYSVALFGHPQDKSDSGIVGNVVETRGKINELSDKLDKVVWGLFGLLATGVIAVIVAIIEITAAKH